MFHTVLPFAGDVAAWQASDRIRAAEIAWTRVHAITDHNTCLKYILSEMIAGLTFRHVYASWASDLHQLKIARSRSNGLQWSRVDLSGASDFHHDQSFIGRLTGRHVEARERRIFIAIIADRTATTNRGRTPRSRPDRAAIAARSSRNHTPFVVESIPRLLSSSFEESGARSTLDRGRSWSIARRTWPILKLSFEAKFKPFRRGFEATTHAQGSASTTLENRPHERVNCLWSSGQFPSLKACISLLCSSTFDRLVKKLSEFRGRSLVHRVPPAFRLDCEAIGAGLITNFSLISSNFPLEFRTSTRKNPSKFASIHENWSPILAAIGLVVRFDRLSRCNLSFY